MSIISWNCRGLGNLRTVQELYRLVKQKKPIMVFLMETKLRKKKMEAIRCKLGFPNMLVVDSVGRSGGLALLWGDDIYLDIQNFSHRHISGVIKNLSGGAPWKFTGFYGHPDVSKRVEAWALIKHLAQLDPIPWVCIGDFNEVLTTSEKLGGSGRANSQMVAFRQTLEFCELTDLGYRGPKFTWSNCQEGSNFIKERLDRGVANAEWRDLFPNSAILVEAILCSDHAPLILCLSGLGGRERRRQRFRYEESWLKEEGYAEIVKQAWPRDEVDSVSWEKIEINMARCQNNFLRWQRGCTGSLKHQIAVLHKQLIDLQGRDEMGIGEETKAVKKKMENLLDQSDLMWRKRAKTEWLRGGDRNTKFFHACANARKKSNFITSISNTEGHIFTSTDEVQSAFVNYFQSLFTSDVVGDMMPCLQPLKKCVTAEMNRDLLKKISEEEVYRALHDMAPLKAPGPDGFTAGFFQKNWSIIGKDICHAILVTLNSGVLPPFLKQTNIALIPKTKNPVSVTDFRPISLCNVMYKMISKILANRLKRILPHIISPVQSAFIPGRLITDNVLVAYETLHTMHSRMKGKKGYMAVKLDMSKAYDRVEWRFLETVMHRLGFDPCWVQLIMMCVSSVEYAVLVNGEPCGQIKPERGLRQGDPISHYLFLICAEALSSMVKKANDDGILTGVSTSRGGPRISHLFFADDSLLFCRANLSQWGTLTNVLRIYEAASGQRLNNDKTSIFFSGNTPQEERNKILEVAGIPSSQRYDTYLGLPALVGKSQKIAFKAITERVWKKLQDWKINFLSQAGKEILLKAVVQAIPTYCMSVFRLPNALCSEINSLMQKFWWGHQDNNSRIHWMSWGRLGLSKATGGMGFRDFLSFNKALLAKQAWRIWSNPQSLVAKTMRAKYFSGSSILEAKLGTRPSFAWRSIFSSCDLLKEGLVWRVGNGEKIRIWKDRWVPSPSTFCVRSPPTLLDPDEKVSKLIDIQSKWWNVPLLESIFSMEEAQLIQTIPISRTNKEDLLLWRGTKSGIFTVKSAYHMQKEVLSNYAAGCSSKKEKSNIWKKIWALPVPSVVRNFLWRACHNILPTRENLCRRKIIRDPLCPLCGRAVESVFHILWQCPSAMDVWTMGCRKIQKSFFLGPDFLQVVEGLFNKCELEELIQFATLARRMWLRRNEVVHGGALTHPHIVMQQTMKAIQEYALAQEKVEEIAPLSGGQVVNCWLAPEQGWCKGNWDAAVDGRTGHMGLGAVIRDSTGTVLAARCEIRRGILSPVAAEAKVALLTVRLCRELGLRKIHLEGDAKTVVDAVNSNEEDRSWVGHLFEDIKGELSSFDGWRMSFVRRDGNHVAHKLARFAVNHNATETWSGAAPDCIGELVALEQLALGT
jgi:ribonuclease HI